MKKKTRWHEARTLEYDIGERERERKREGESLRDNIGVDEVQVSMTSKAK